MTTSACHGARSLDMRSVSIYTAAALAVSTVGIASAQDVVQIDVASAFPVTMPILGEVSTTLPETVQLAPGEILTALESGELDATEFSLPAMDQKLGFELVAKYCYFPGWHQQATLFDLYFKLDDWNALEPRYQTAIETACSDMMREMIAQGEAEQWRAMQANGVKLKRWPPEILVASEDAWLEIVAEESAVNPNFARVYESYQTFRDNYAIWRHFSFLR